MEESLKHLLMTASANKTTLDQRLDHLLTYSKSDTDDDTCNQRRPPTTTPSRRSAHGPTRH
ncbi:hypothetical protein GCM10010270_06600 [Streptomyces violaceus]|nr:hypothetical protein GCM10010270_06600 [Streptomyces janthinus]